MANNSRVLVLDADQRSALATVRSLGSKGINVQTAGDGPNALAANSKYSQKYHCYPSPEDSEDAFIESLANIVAREQIDTVFPMTEVTSRVLLSRGNRLEHITLPFPTIDKVLQLSDKLSLIELAEKLNIPHPYSRRYNSANELLEDTQSQSFPLVLKPGLSRVRDQGGWHTTTVRIVSDSAQLNTCLQKSADFKHPFMLQQYIEGQGQGIFALYNRGNAVCFFAHRRIREKPPWGGVSVLCESAAPDPDMLALSKKLLDHVGWHGVAMVEFKVDSSGTPYLMEVNTRFWGSLQLAIDSGVDFPHLLYMTNQGDTPTTTGNYTIGQKLRWYLGDLDSLYITLKDTRYSAAIKTRRLLQFVTPDLGGTRHEIFRWNDPKPAWFEFKKYLSQH